MEATIAIGRQARLAVAPVLAIGIKHRPRFLQFLSQPPGAGALNLPAPDKHEPNLKQVLVCPIATAVKMQPVRACRLLKESLQPIHAHQSYLPRR